MPSGEERSLLVREMFDRIARRYDLLNTVMTAGLNRIWNGRVIDAKIPRVTPPRMNSRKRECP